MTPHEQAPRLGRRGLFVPSAYSYGLRSQRWIVRLTDATAGVAATYPPTAADVEEAHLAYASTVHGIQGETVDTSIVGPGVDAAGSMSG